MDFSLLTGGAEQFLDGLGRVLSAGRTFEEEGLGAVDLQVLLDQILEVVRQGDLPILVAFGLADDQYVAFPIDVVFLKVHCLRYTQTTGIDQAQDGLPF